MCVHSVVILEGKSASHTVNMSEQNSFTKNRYRCNGPASFYFEMTGEANFNEVSLTGSRLYDQFR